MASRNIRQDWDGGLNHVLGYGRFGDIVAEKGEFGFDSLHAPGGILLR